MLDKFLIPVITALIIMSFGAAASAIIQVKELEVKYSDIRSDIVEIKTDLREIRNLLIKEK